MRLSNHDVSAHLYRLLVYEAGSFFLPHRDGEKQDGMVATLVITLPRKHTGGELIVRHEGKEATLQTLEAAWLRAINYTAFYADCDHEVRPLNKGFRVSLIYNLTAKLNLERAAASAAEGTPAGLGNVFAEWPKGLAKAVVVLNHRYTQQGISAELLKGSDQAKAKQIFEAATQANCDCYLTLLTRQEQGDADYYLATGSSFYSRNTEWDEAGRSKRNIQPMRMNELYEWSMTLDGWVDAHGTPAPLRQAKVKPEELICTVAWDSVIPSREEVHGYLGNEGLTIDRWYHRAAMVVLPPKAE
jgi:hypothetical protein